MLAEFTSQTLSDRKSVKGSIAFNGTESIGGSEMAKDWWDGEEASAESKLVDSSFVRLFSVTFSFLKQPRYRTALRRLSNLT